MIENVIITLVSILGGGGLLVWLLRALASKGLDVLAQSHAERMPLEHARDLEAFKSELQIAAHELQARSTTLVTRQSEVIAEVYRLLVICENELHG